MTPCPGDNTITLMVCGQLEGVQVEALEAHVAGCASCGKLVGALETVLSHVGAGRTAPHFDASLIGILAPGTVVGRYRIDDLLGAGGMGVVYAAYDPELDRRVALKLLYPTLELDGHAELAERLRHESKAMAKLRHPNVATIFDIGSYRDQLFLVMELVAGTTLRAWVGGDQPWSTVIATFVEAGKGLAAAHDAGIVHCDFKPDNVLLHHNGRPMVSDFGLAQVVAGARARPHAGNVELDAHAGAIDSSSIIGTANGQVFGTPAYMAPERFEPATAADIQGDVFAFCVALFEVLYGKRPFDGHTVADLRVAVGKGLAARPIDNARIPRWVHRILARGLHPDLAIRYASMSVLLAALQASPRRRSIAWLAAGVSAVVLAGAGWQLSRHDAAAAAPSCDARGELAGIWDVTSRIRIGAAVMANGNVTTARAWDRISHSLDRYTDQWVAAADTVCKAPPPTDVAADFERRCLRSIRGQLRTVTDQFASSGPAIAATAEHTVARLRSVDDCGSAVPAAPVPTDFATRIEVGLLRDQLAAADGQSIAGKFELATAAIDAVATKAVTLGYKPLAAEVQYARAMNLRGAAAKPEVTTAALRDAAAQAEACGHEVLAVKAWTSLAFQAGVIADDTTRGREYAKYAAAALERLGGNERLEADLVLARGRMDELDHKLDDARKEFEHTLALANTDPVHYLEALSDICVVDASAGRFADALAENLHVLELRRKMYGDEHPEIARSYTQLGGVLMDLGRNTEALDYYEKADALAVRLFGPEHTMIGITAHNLGGIYRDLGRPVDAERAYRRAIRITTLAFGPDHPYTAKSEQSLGMALFDQGKFADAVTELRHAVEVKRKALGDDHLETIGAMNDLGIALRGAGQLDEALAYTDKAIVGFVATEGPQSDDLGQAYVARARTLTAMHRNHDASVALDHAATIYSHIETAPERLVEVRKLQGEVAVASRAH